MTCFWVDHQLLCVTKYWITSLFDQTNTEAISMLCCSFSLFSWCPDMNQDEDDPFHMTVSHKGCESTPLAPIMWNYNPARCQFLYSSFFFFLISSQKSKVRETACCHAVLSSKPYRFLLQFSQDSQFPLVDGDRGVSISPAGQLNILTVQVPVSIKALDLHLRFICKEGTSLSVHPSGAQT